jgi:hypothetical protein
VIPNKIETFISTHKKYQEVTFQSFLGPAYPDVTRSNQYFGNRPVTKKCPAAEPEGVGLELIDQRNWLVTG